MVGGVGGPDDNGEVEGLWSESDDVADVDEYEDEYEDDEEEEEDKEGDVVGNACEIEVSWVGLGLG